jgi:hypothetical protein
VSVVKTSKKRKHRTPATASANHARKIAIERQIAESFSANAALDRRLITDFAHVDADIDAQ